MKRKKKNLAKKTRCNVDKDKRRKRVNRRSTKGRWGGEYQSAAQS
jgi:hypothetical protein